MFGFKSEVNTKGKFEEGDNSLSKWAAERAMLTSEKKNVSGNQDFAPSNQRKGGLVAKAAGLFQEASKVRRLPKKKTTLWNSENIMDASVSEELVADHEWETLLDTFENEGDELVGDAEEHDLWERLSSTRWLKATPTRASARKAGETGGGESLLS